MNICTDKIKGPVNIKFLMNEFESLFKLKILSSQHLLQPLKRTDPHRWTSYGI